MESCTSQSIEQKLATALDALRDNNKFKAIHDYETTLANIAVDVPVILNTMANEIITLFEKYQKLKGTIERSCYISEKCHVETTNTSISQMTANDGGFDNYMFDAPMIRAVGGEKKDTVIGKYRIVVTVKPEIYYLSRVEFYRYYKITMTCEVTM